MYKRQPAHPSNGITYLAALRMGIKYPAKFSDMPYRSACVITKVNGKNIPQKKQNAPASVSANFNSASGRTKLKISNGLGRCGSLDLRVILAIPNMNKMRKAQMRIAQGNPTSGISLVTMIGKMTPPRLEPAAVTPRAKARRAANQVLTELTEALKMALAPMGLQIPCARMNW